MLIKKMSVNFIIMCYEKNCNCGKVIFCESKISYNKRLCPCPVRKLCVPCKPYYKIYCHSNHYPYVGIHYNKCNSHNNSHYQLHYYDYPLKHQHVVECCDEKYDDKHHHHKHHNSEHHCSEHHSSEHHNSEHHNSEHHSSEHHCQEHHQHTHIRHEYINNCIIIE
jgi:hypothetical protein